MNRNRRIFPDMTSEEGGRRFCHNDIRDLSRPEVAAELATLEAHLARLVFFQSTPRMIWSRTDGSLVSDQEWIAERLDHLRARYGKRRVP